MRILRVPSDFRVVEQFDDSMLTRKGDYLIYSVLKKGMTTGEAAERLAQAAGVGLESVVAAGQKPREGVSGQIFSILDGEPLALRSPEFAVRRLGVSDRHVEAADLTGNAYEVVVRDLRGDDMRRLRHNLAQLRQTGMPNYFDDQRFGCLRHGQGYLMRDILRGRYEQALRAALAAPSPYGSEQVERYKAQIRQMWGDWSGLVRLANGRRGKSAFEHLAEHEGDFLGALRLGLASRERTMHLFAYQSHLYNRALAARVRSLIEDEANLAWLPCDEGSLPVWRELPVDVLRALEKESLPLPGPGLELNEQAMRWYAPIFEAEKIRFEEFCAVDLPGFRPALEERPTIIEPEFLRAAPAQDDEIYKRSRKMRVRFTLPRGHYATLLLKRLLMPTEAGAGRMCIWVSRHPLVWPLDDGTPQFFERRERQPDDHGDRGPRGPRREFDRGRDRDRPRNWDRDRDQNRDWGRSRDQDRDRRGSRDDRERGPRGPRREPQRGPVRQDRESPWGKAPRGGRPRDEE